ncbi:MAG TPA: DNA translocase FtsK 4TM domain-containing protein [Phycisphaerales bacterium]|nr:DNA translocase FtsK 4TM domain-containing protein [Phycisphaerales bacterium]HMP35867.1 DNA translocase FtsK 4TM domain-containing protein [Phycisphaerales bacterium]
MARSSRQARSTVPARPHRRGASSTEALVQPAIALPLRRALWLVAATLWAFVVLSLATFDLADWPSEVVAVHRQVTANAGGSLGALLAWRLMLLFGPAVWVPVIGAGALLGFIAAGRPIGHPVLRAVGSLIFMVAFGGLHALWLGDLGGVPGVSAGLAGTAAAQELAQRFGTPVVGLTLVAALLIGAVTAADGVVMALPRATWRTLRAVAATTRSASDAVAGAARSVNPVPALRRLAALRRPAPAVAVGRRIGEDGAGDEQGTEAGAFDAAGWTEASPAERSPALDEEAAAAEHEHEDEWLGEDDACAAEAEIEEAAEGDDEETDEEDPADDRSDDGLGAEEDESEDEGDAQRREPLSHDELRAKIARLPVRMTSRPSTVARDEDIPRQAPADGSWESYRFPTLELLDDPETNYSEKMEAFVRQQAEVLEETLQTFSIDAEVVGIESGPVVTLFSVQLAPGTRVARLQTISSDIARSLQAQNIRILPNTAGKTTVGIEVPNLQKEKVRLKELMSGGAAEGMALPMFLGKDASGEPLVADLTRMPHMLIAGTTGSGKSVCMNSIIMSWLYTKRPDELKLVLVDPKMVEMSQFADIPHLMCPVVTEMGKASAILEWAVDRMEERYELLREAGVRDLTGYNAMTEEELCERFEPTNDLERARIPKKLPYMVFVIDELADLMMTNKEVEHFIVRIAQKARAVGIHLILATQRPQANVVTGLIKSNMPCRVSFKVASGMDSRIVLDSKGAELLLGQGDMLFLNPKTSEIRRAQGTLLTDGEIRRVMRFLKEVAAPSFERSLLSLRSVSKDDEPAGELDASERDPLFDKAVEIMIETGRGSVSLLQRRLAIGYSRASRLVDQMGLAGILGDHKGSVAREVMITAEEWQQMKALEEAEAKAGTIFEEDDG